MSRLEQAYSKDHLKEVLENLLSIVFSLFPQTLEERETTYTFILKILAKDQSWKEQIPVLFKSHFKHVIIVSSWVIWD